VLCIKEALQAKIIFAPDALVRRAISQGFFLRNVLFEHAWGDGIWLNSTDKTL
jgi:hypothetical protein